MKTRPTTKGPSTSGDSQFEEYRMSAMKVELPMSDGDDSAAWIARAKIYFDVQNTPQDVKLKLAWLSMEDLPFIGSICWLKPERNVMGEVEEGTYRALWGMKIRKPLL